MNDIEAPVAPPLHVALKPKQAQSASETKPFRRKLIKPVGALVVTGMAAGGLYLGAKAYAENSQTDKIAESRKQVIKNIEQFRNDPIKPLAEIVVLHAGVHLRSTPEKINDYPLGLAKGNVVYTVPKGEEIVIVRPVEMVTNKKETWDSFSFSGDKPDKKSAFKQANTIAGQRLFFQPGALQSQNDKDNSLISIYNIDETEVSELAKTFTLNNAGQYVDTAGGEVVAWGEHDKAGAYERFMAMPKTHLADNR